MLFRTTIVLIITFYASGCGEAPGPKGQQDFTAAVAALKDEFNAAENSGNKALEKKAEEKALRFFKETPRRAESWIGEVVSVGDGDVLTVKVKYDDQKYYLLIVEPQARTYVEKLKRGDRVIFTGDLGAETSVTVSGALSEPEFRLYPEKLKKDGESDETHQDAGLAMKHAADATEKQKNKERAVDLCEAAAKSRVAHPSTFDFSRVFDLDVKEYPNGRININSTFTTKNDYDMKLKYSIRCLADETGLIEVNISEDNS